MLADMLPLRSCDWGRDGTDEAPKAGYCRVGSGRLFGVLYATFFGGRGGSSSSLNVKSMTSDPRLLPVRGAVEASREESGGV